MNSIPRRINVDKNVPAELAIRVAMDAVERLGADLRLTQAVDFLGKALDQVGDWVDNVPLKESGV